jgi:hypothetical protein
LDFIFSAVKMSEAVSKIPAAYEFLANIKQPAFNESIPSGGDPAKIDVNAQYVGFEYHYTYLVFCGFIVWVIIPGIGLLYGGLARRKSALALLFQSLMVAAVTSVQYVRLCACFPSYLGTGLFGSLLRDSRSSIT